MHKIEEDFIVIIMIIKLRLKIHLYKDLKIETTRMWGMRTETVPVIIGTLGLIIIIRRRRRRRRRRRGFMKTILLNLLVKF